MSATEQRYKGYTIQYYENNGWSALIYRPEAIVPLPGATHATRTEGVEVLLARARERIDGDGHQTKP